MIKIQITKNLAIKQCEAAPNSWDLVYTFIGKRGPNKAPIECERFLAYGIDFDHILQYIADHEISIEEDEEMTLADYIEKYQTIQNEALEKLKEFFNNK